MVTKHDKIMMAGYIGDKYPELTKAFLDKYKDWDIKKVK